MTTLITAQTDAATSGTIDINVQKPVSGPAFDQGQYTLGATFRVTGGALGAGETVTLQYHDGSDWRDAVINANAGVILDASNSVRTLYGRMTDIRVSKSATAAARGVEVV
jgi:hypothetical protein